MPTVTHTVSHFSRSRRVPSHSSGRSRRVRVWRIGDFREKTVSHIRTNSFLISPFSSVTVSARKPKRSFTELPATGVPEHISQKGARFPLSRLYPRQNSGTARERIPAFTSADTAREGKIHAAKGVTGTARDRRTSAFASALPNMPSAANSRQSAAKASERRSMKSAPAVWMYSSQKRTAQMPPITAAGYQVAR